MSFTITRGNRRRITVTPTKKDGSPAQLDGPIEGEVITGTVTVSPADGSEGRANDTNSIYVNAVGDLGDFQVDIVADARLGPERRDIRVQLNGSVIDEEASNLGINVGDEEPIPAATPAA